MNIPVTAWIKYIDSLRNVDEKASDLMKQYIETHALDSREAIDEAIQYAYKVSTVMGEAAAAIACDMYDAVSLASDVSVPAALPAQTATYGEVAKTVNGIIKNGYVLTHIATGIERLVKRAGVDTTVQNAIRDHAEWAWIPHGDTCAFCLVLASRGWQKASAEALKGNHATHIHGNCDCTYAIRHKKDTSYDGYDPDDYKRMYHAADGRSAKDKINSIRRMQYAEHKDIINEQKRAAYAARVERSQVDTEGFGGDNNQMRHRNQDDPIAYITEDVIDKQFGDSIQRAVYMTDERIRHIDESHPGAFDVFGRYIPDTISHPDMVLQSNRDKETAMFIKRVDQSGLAVMVKVAQSKNHADRTFVKTMHPVGTRSINKMKRKNKVVYLYDKK